MNPNFHNKENLVSCCHLSLEILSKYYHFDPIENIEPFLMNFSHQIPDNCGQTFFQENGEKKEFFIGVQFGKKIFLDVENNTNVPLNSIAVIAEEMSHFQIITDIAKKNNHISRLEIETLGEIDRFLCLMHWNSQEHQQKINKNWKNIHEMCDDLFFGERFKSDNSLYFKAESLAFKHLKKAFHSVWDSSYFNFIEINKKAEKYLCHLRKIFLKELDNIS